MVMRKIFGRKKKDKDKDEEVADPEVEVVVEPVKPVEPTEPTDTEAVDVPPAEKPAGTIPYHDSLSERINYMLTDSEMSKSIEGTDEFRLEFMAMGERFGFIKESKGEVEKKPGSITDEDVFIRVANDTVSELLNAATFADFSKIYMQYYKNADAGKFVKIELRKAISDLNRRGFARVPLLKLLVGAAR